MISALFAALLLQTASPPIPADCTIDNSQPTPCIVIMASEPSTSTLGVGFLTDAGTVIVSGQQTSAPGFSIMMLSLGDTTVPARGECKVQPKILECRVITAAVNFTIKAQAR